MMGISGSPSSAKQVRDLADLVSLLRDPKTKGRLQDLADRMAKVEVAEAAVAEARKAVDADAAANAAKAKDLTEVNSAYKKWQDTLVERERQASAALEDVKAKQMALKVEAEALAERRETMGAEFAQLEKDKATLADIEVERATLEKDKTELQRRVNRFTELRQQATKLMAEPS